MRQARNRRPRSERRVSHVSRRAPPVLRSLTPAREIRVCCTGGWQLRPPTDPLLGHIAGLRVAPLLGEGFY